MIKDKLRKFDQFFLEYLLFPLAMFFLIIVCFMILSFTSHAASPYFPMSQNYNSKFSGAISLIESTFDSDNNYYFVIYRGQNITFATDYAYIIYFPKSSGTPSLYGEIANQNNQFSLYKIGNVEFTYKSFDIYWQGGNTPIIRNISVIEDSTVMWRTFYSSNYDPSSDYLSNFRVYTDNSPDREIILNYSGGNNEYDDPGNDTFPNNADKPDINDYIDYNDFPSFDSSDGIGSLWNIVKYSFGVVIPGLGNYIIDSINWGFQKVINNIRYVVKNVSTELQEVINDFSDFVNGFLSDIRDFVSDIKTDVEYLVEPLQSSEVNTAFTSTNFYGIKTQFTNTFTSFDNAFDISEPNTFTLTINIQNIDTFYNFGCRSPVIIHLDEHFTPIKTALRTFLWILISFGTVFVVEKGLSNWLRGDRKE